MGFLFWKILIIYFTCYLRYCPLLCSRNWFICNGGLLWNSVECRALGNRVTEARRVHKRLERSRSNIISSTVCKSEGYCVRLQNSNFSSTAHSPCDPGQIKSLVTLVSSSGKACLIRRLRGLNKWIHVMNAEPCMITTRAQQMCLWLKQNICHVPIATLCTLCSVSMH